MVERLVLCCGVYISARQWRAQQQPSVCPSICLSVTRVDQSKMVEARVMQFSLYSSPIPLVFAA